MSVALILLGFGFVLWLYIIWSRRRFYLFALKCPGLLGWPLLGIALRLRSLETFLYEIAKIAEELNSDIGFSWLGPMPFLATIDPVVAEKILTSPDCLDRPYLYDVFVEALGSGLLTIGSPKCTSHRKMLNPTFKHGVLLSFFTIFNEGSDSLIHDLDSLVGKGESDISSSFYACTLRISIETTMGMDGNQHREKCLKVLPYSKIVLLTTMNRLLKPWLRIEAIFRYTSMYKPYKEAKSNVDAFINEILSKKLIQKQNEQTNIKDLESSSKNVEANESIDLKSKNRFIDQAIQLYQSNDFDWNDFFGESSSIIYAAFETTANTIHTVLIMLAMHPHYQERLFEEITSVIPEKDSYISYDDISKLTYLDMVISETLRIASTVPIIARHIGADLYISDKLTIPKGVDVIIDIFEMHRRKEIWGPHANDFDPDNFLPENLATKHPFAYIPFSKGTRRCLGWYYAKMLLKVVLAKVLRNYRFTTTFPLKELHYMLNLTLRFKVMPQLEVHRR